MVQRALAAKVVGEELLALAHLLGHLFNPHAGCLERARESALARVCRAPLSVCGRVTATLTRRRVMRWSFHPVPAAIVAPWGHNNNRGGRLGHDSKPHPLFAMHC